MRCWRGMSRRKQTLLLLLGCAFLSQSCEALWGPFGRENPANCVVSSAGCGADEVCEPTSQVCVSALRLDSATPALASSRGGTTVTLRGQRFVAGAAVFVDEQPATDVVVVSSEELRFTLPGSTRGLWRVPVAVQNPSQHRSERRDLFAYYAETLAFESRSIAVSGLPIDAAVGDWNGDQKLDLAVIGIPSSGVQILIGDGSGGFSAAGSVAVGSATMTTNHIASIDGNHDGKSDLLVAAGGSLNLLLGDGQGGFPTRRVLYSAAVGNVLGALAVGDYDGDGRADIVLSDVVSDNSAAKVVLLPNGGDDGFATQSIIETSQPPSLLRIADLTADARSDVLVGIEGTRLSLWRNDGGSARTRIDLPLSGCSARNAAVGDLDHDGRQDLLLRCDASLRPLLSLGDGQFSPLSDHPLPPPSSLSRSLALSDLNGDGWLDGGMGSGDGSGGAKVVGVLGDGMGGFSAEQEIAGYPASMLNVAHSLQTADWDGDGKIDVLSLSSSANPSCRLLLNRSR